MPRNTAEAKPAEPVEETAPAEIPTVAQANELFDNAVLLGSQIAELPPNEPFPPKLRIGRRYKKLEVQARQFEGWEFVYSGTGFRLVEDPDKDLVTAYGPIKYGRGVLNAIYITDSVDLKYMRPKNINLDEDGDGEAYTDTLAVVDDYTRDLKAFRDTLGTAPDGLRLFAEFIIKEKFMEEEQVGGVCLRGDLNAYQVVDTSSIEIIDVIPPEKGPYIVHPDFIRVALDPVTQTYRQMLQNKGFRNMSAKAQQELIETALHGINSTVRIDRFEIISAAKNLYLPCTQDGKQTFEEFPATTNLWGKCIGIDCIELQQVADGKAIRRRKGNLNSYGSLCVVTELADLAVKSLGLSSNIVWVPLFEQLGSMSFTEKSVAHNA